MPKITDDNMLSNLNLNLITQQFKDFIKSFSNENTAEKTII